MRFLSFGAMFLWVAIGAAFCVIFRRGDQFDVGEAEE